MIWIADPRPIYPDRLDVGAGRDTRLESSLHVFLRVGPRVVSRTSLGLLGLRKEAIREIACGIGCWIGLDQTSNRAAIQRVELQRDHPPAVMCGRGFVRAKTIALPILQQIASESLR